MSDIFTILTKYTGGLSQVFNFLPSGYLYLSTFLIVLVSIFLIFKGSFAWTTLLMMVGAYFGVIFALYLSKDFSTTSLPLYLILVIGAVAGAVLVKGLIHIALPGAIAFLVYLVGTAVYPNFVYDVIAGLVAFVIAYALYDRITAVLAAVIGALLMWFALYTAGMNDTVAQVIAATTFVLGLTLQYMEKTRYRRYSRFTY